MTLLEFLKFLKFLIVRITSSVFCGSVLSEFLRMTRCILLFEDFIPKVVELLQRMLTQGGDCHLVVKQI